MPRYQVECAGLTTFERLDLPSGDVLYASRFVITNPCSSPMLFKVMANAKAKKGMLCRPNQGCIAPGDSATILATLSVKLWNRLPIVVNNEDSSNNGQRGPHLVVVTLPHTRHDLDVTTHLSLLRRTSAGSSRKRVECWRSLKIGRITNKTAPQNLLTRAQKPCGHPDSFDQHGPASTAQALKSVMASEPMEARKVRRGHGDRHSNYHTDASRSKRTNSPVSTLLKSMTSKFATTKDPVAKKNRKPGGVDLRSELVVARLPCVGSAMRVLRRCVHNLRRDTQNHLNEFGSLMGQSAQQILFRFSRFTTRRRKRALLLPTENPSNVKNVTDGATSSGEPHRDAVRQCAFHILCRQLPATPLTPLSTPDAANAPHPGWPATSFSVKKPSGYVWKNGTQATFCRFTCDGFFNSSLSVESVGRRVYDALLDPAPTSDSKVETSVNPFNIVVLYGEHERGRERSSYPVENLRQVHSQNTRAVRAFLKRLLQHHTVRQFGGLESPAVLVSMVMCFDGSFFDMVARKIHSNANAAIRYVHMLNRK